MGQSLTVTCPSNLNQKSKMNEVFIIFVDTLDIMCCDKAI